MVDRKLSPLPTDSAGPSPDLSRLDADGQANVVLHVSHGSGGEAPTLIDILRRRAVEQADDIVYTHLVDGDTKEVHLSFAELWRRSQAWLLGTAAFCLSSGTNWNCSKQLQLVAETMTTAATASLSMLLLWR